MADPYVLPDAVPVYAGDSWTPNPWERGYLATPGDESSFVGYDYSTWSTWAAQWRPDPESADVIELTVVHDEAAAGKFGVSATPTQTRQMAVLLDGGTSGVFDIQVSNGPDSVLTLFRGKTKHTGDVTRD